LRLQRRGVSLFRIGVLEGKRGGVVVCERIKGRILRKRGTWGLTFFVFFASEVITLGMVNNQRGSAGNRHCSPEVKQGKGTKTKTSGKRGRATEKRGRLGLIPFFQSFVMCRQDKSA